MSNDARHGPPTDFEKVEVSEPFARLKKRHRGFVWPLTAVFIIWYFAYVLLASYAPDFMSTKVIGNINIGLLLGFGQFVTTFAITTWYVSFANRQLDPLAAEIRADLEATEGAHR